MTTETQISANRRNAAKSTGPRTMQGKAIVAQNAIKHGLLARRNVIVGEDQQEFDLHRRGLLEELRPVGDMETLLGERIVSLTWRLKRAERLQNEVFESLLARELDESMEEFDDDLSADEEREMRSDPNTDPGFAIGRMVAADFRRDRVLDRLLTYERQIEGSLRKTMADLEHRQLKHKAEGGHNPVHELLGSPAANSVKQSQTRASEENHRRAAIDDAARDGVSDCVKQSQLPEDVPGETKPVSGFGTLESERPSCETKPISGDVDASLLGTAPFVDPR